jgi:transposase
MDLTGIGPSGAARLMVDVGDSHRFADRDKFASWNGTAPLDASSGEQKRHTGSPAPATAGSTAHCTSRRSCSCATAPKAGPTSMP